MNLRNLKVKKQRFVNQRRRGMKTLNSLQNRKIYLMIHASLINSPRTKINSENFCSQLKAKSNNISEFSSKRKRKNKVVSFSILSEEILCWRRCHTYLCWCKEIWFRSPALKTTRNWTATIWCHHDGPAMEALNLTTIPWRCYSISQSKWWSHWKSSHSQTAKRRVFIGLGYQRQIPIHNASHGKKVGL